MALAKLLSLSPYAPWTCAPGHLPSSDDDLYKVDELEVAFFKELTGIQDDVALREHLFNIQCEAYAAHPFASVRRLAWRRLQICRLFPYPALMKLGKEREDAIFLDLACSLGINSRRVVADAFPARNIVASDPHEAFWHIGHKLFKTTPDSYPVTFVPGDVFDRSHLEPLPPFTLADPPDTPVPTLSSLTSLNPLRGHVSATHVSGFFHLVPEIGQRRLAHSLGCLLSPEPGSMIFGQHAGQPTKGFRRTPRSGSQIFCHSPESWTELWDGEVFEKGTVRVETELVEMSTKELEKICSNPLSSVYLFTWSVTRL
ncbi:hypothetical protein BV25DRAFT_1832101 [Artomyces pyxidatus]|uniref:Uncharacterized protein n=1 Tax=Artomyces pyxidatus TaxID=48021 RepID=A0ACB8SJE3_9AGAM|nr:hypothetical protein BV25DRAFT_1832101 [Artomyces pyxidatus]